MRKLPSTLSGLVRSRSPPSRARHDGEPQPARKDVKELIAYAKANPASSIRLLGHRRGRSLTCELFKQTVGIDMVHIPFKNAPAMQAAMANDIQLSRHASSLMRRCAAAAARVECFRQAPDAYATCRRSPRPAGRRSSLTGCSHAPAAPKESSAPRRRDRKASGESGIRDV